MWWAGHVAFLGGMIIVRKYLVAKPETKRRLGGKRQGGEDNIKTDHKGTECGRRDWI
jgi:hypothetical protein